MKPLRVYVDTSVIGGCLDEQFREESCRLLDAARAGRLTLLVSAVVGRELASAPPELLDLVRGLPAACVQEVALTEEIIALRDAYLDAAIVSRKWSDDATHVAAATVGRADAIVSWNFRHIVRLDKMKAYNRVNLLNGYGILTIISPREVFPDESDEH